ncbi:MAG: methylated-DNA--[protein]-cysteine S-methyltransferase [Pseudomonadales bacterium]|nr:methylated-DNA--[protein]-cysteine S-methyltransferase [Pseudomonadales bacterium]
MCDPASEQTDDFLRRLDLASPLAQRVLEVVNSIPLGRVASYGQVAAMAGAPRAARYVGNCMRHLPPNLNAPWHRVLRRNGEIARRPGAERQKERLRAEGVAVNGNRVSMSRFQWIPSTSSKIHKRASPWLRARRVSRGPAQP